MKVTPQQLLESRDFHELIVRRWTLSILLTSFLLVLYYGYILLIALEKAFLSRRIGEATTLAIPMGAAVIAGAWALTAIYVLWANRRYDPEVARLRNQLIATSQDPR